MFGRILIPQRGLTINEFAFKIYSFYQFQLSTCLKNELIILLSIFHINS